MVQNNMSITNASFLSGAWQVRMCEAGGLCENNGGQCELIFDKGGPRPGCYLSTHSLLLVVSAAVLLDFRAPLVFIIFRSPHGDLHAETKQKSLHDDLRLRRTAVRRRAAMRQCTETTAFARIGTMVQA